MPLSSGTTVGHYEILEQIGAGGMGEVYRARDTQLKRDVALKVLPAAFANNADRMARFQREAEVLASLNHPGIAAIYGLAHSDTTRALVMELVEGPTLADRIRDGAIPEEEALPIAKQIAEALEYAHERNVIHRDLKPANVKITPEGTVKLLDFGLAKAMSDLPISSDPANSPTLTMGATQAGMVLGTAAYMAPEQARGKSADKRADIWAFGVVLCEMLTAKHLYTGELVSDILAAVIAKEPELGTIPAHLRPLITKCLRKDPRQRWRDIGDVRMALEESSTALQPVVAPPAAPPSKLPWISTALAAVAALAFAFLYFRQPAQQPSTAKLFLTLPEKATLTGQTLPAVSPDGRHIAFTAILDSKTVLLVRDLDSLTSRVLPGTDGAAFPFWSPDSRSIGFFAGGKLKRIDAAGGPALTLCDASGDPRGGTWNQNGVIVFIPDRLANASLYRVSAAGGTPARIREPDPSKSEQGFRFPWFLPDGRHFLFLRRVQDQAASMIYVGELDSKDERPLLAATSNAVYSAGHLLFARERTLMAQPFDPAIAQTTGEAVPIAEDVDYAPIDQRSHFSASQNGVLTFVSRGFVGAAGSRQLSWMDRSGKVSGRASTPGLVTWPAISPDGKVVAFQRYELNTGLGDIWLHDLARGADSRFTFGRETNEYAAWSPDGNRLAYRSGPNINQRATGIAQEEVLDTGPPIKRPDDWSKDGNYIIEEVSANAKTGYDIWSLPLTGDKKSVPYLDTQFNERWAKLSPDGHWLAYASDETKRFEVYVQTFPKRGGQFQVSTAGGEHPVWSRDGKELFYISADGKMMAVEVKGGAAKFEAGVPKALFDIRIGVNDTFDVAKDGRFLVAIPTSDQPATVPLTVVLNWPAGLKR